MSDSSNLDIEGDKKITKEEINQQDEEMLIKMRNLMNEKKIENIQKTLKKYKNGHLQINNLEKHLIFLRSKHQSIKDLYSKNVHSKSKDQTQNNINKNNIIEKNKQMKKFSFITDHNPIKKKLIHFKKGNVVKEIDIKEMLRKFQNSKTCILYKLRRI